MVQRLRRKKRSSRFLLKSVLREFCRTEEIGFARHGELKDGRKDRGKLHPYSQVGKPEKRGRGSMLK